MPCVGKKLGGGGCEAWVGGCVGGWNDGTSAIYFFRWRGLGRGLSVVRFSSRIGRCGAMHCQRLRHARVLESSSVSSFNEISLRRNRLSSTLLE